MNDYTRIDVMVKDSLSKFQYREWDNQNED
jgi:hypothetical protein